MTIIIFIIILSVLVFVHEMGHFLVAKLAGVRVDEFGFGYPPRAFKMFRKWGTDFTINWVPFGGFVKIFGENAEEGMSDDRGRKFTEVSKKWQVAILSAGVVFNILFAWILLSVGFMFGMPYSTQDEMGALVHDKKLMITSVLPDSPAQIAGIKSGDVILGMNRAGSNLTQISPEGVSNFVNKSDNLIHISLQRGKKTITLDMYPKANIVSNKIALGISMDTVGTLSLPFHKALIYGARTTYNIFVSIISGIALLFRGGANLSQVAGPVGIIGLVGDATALGLIYLLSFTVVISINLAVVNLIPFPALDGGRIFFVIIEYFKGSPVNPKVFNAINAFGFFILIGLMILVTWHDVAKLF
jgi:regulator of sigma E protease